jgi:FKBP-type peptidyl-prolyl cis-trans isomerase SlpA
MTTLAEGALVTLHYRITLDDGTEVMSTFGGNPATLAIGGGDLAPGFERCLARAEEGRTETFELAAVEAFGEAREELLQRIRRAELPAGIKLEPGVLLEFPDGTGGRHGALVRGLSGEGADEEVLLDFNHPLAERAVRFEVRVLAKL